MREARERQPEVIQPVHQNGTSHRDIQCAGIGEVGQPHAAGFVFLAEDHVLLRPMLRTPVRNAPLQCAANVRIYLWVPPPHFGEHANRADAGRRFQDRHDLGLPDRGQRVWPPPFAGRLLLRRQAWIGIDAEAGGATDAGLGGGNGRVVGFSDTHVQPHLVVGDVEAGQMLIPQLLRRIRTLPQTCPTARRVSKERRRVWPAVGRAPPSLRQPTHGAFSS